MLKRERYLKTLNGIRKVNVPHFWLKKKNDLYTKIILTIIAIAMSGLFLQNFFNNKTATASDYIQYKDETTLDDIYDKLNELEGDVLSIQNEVSSIGRDQNYILSNTFGKFCTSCPN